MNTDQRSVGYRMCSCHSADIRPSWDVPTRKDFDDAVSVTQLSSFQSGLGYFVQAIELVQDDGRRTWYVPRNFRLHLGAGGIVRTISLPLAADESITGFSGAPIPLRGARALWQNEVMNLATCPKCWERQSVVGGLNACTNCGYEMDVNEF